MLLSNLFCLFQLQQALHKVNFTKFLKLNPDPHWESSWIWIRIENTSWCRIRIENTSWCRIRIENNSWIRIREKWCGPTALLSNNASSSIRQGWVQKINKKEFLDPACFWAEGIKLGTDSSGLLQYSYTPEVRVGDQGDEEEGGGVAHLPVTVRYQVLLHPVTCIIPVLYIRYCSTQSPALYQYGYSIHRIQYMWSTTKTTIQCIFYFTPWPRKIPCEAYCQKWD